MDDSNNPGFFFTVMSYNVLAQNLLQEHQYLYHEHDKKALTWEMRWTNLLHEINKHAPEVGGAKIVCLFFGLLVCCYR